MIQPTRTPGTLACLCMTLWLGGITAVTAQDRGATLNEPPTSAKLQLVKFDPEGPPQMEWMSLDGSGPPTYEDYVAANPERPARFSSFSRAFPVRGGGRDASLGILVDADLYASIQPGLTQYTADLTDAGYGVTIEAISGGTNEEIKAWVAQRYAEGCEGVVFIGDIRAAWYAWPRSETETDIFPCDLFYQDLDGHWEDSDGNGIYDIHETGTGDQGPEVYVARMYTTTLSWDTSANMLNDYFAKAHAWRQRQLIQPERGLEFVDEPWYGFDYFQHQIFGDDVVRQDHGHLTTGQRYLAQLAQGYHFVQVCAHSGGDVHFFGVRPTQAAAYAHVYVYSPQTRTAMLLIGADDGIRTWFNGDHVCTHSYCGAWQVDRYAHTVTLLEGWNRLLCKVAQEGGDYGFSARLVDVNNNPLTDLLYQLNDPDIYGWDPHNEFGSHIGNWLMNGLYENDDWGTRLTEDYLASVGGEVNVHPSEGDLGAYGAWETVSGAGVPTDLAAYYEERYSPSMPVTSADIQFRDPEAFFFNLFACGSGCFTHTNYLGGSYIFHTTYGLITVASSKSGSMVNFPYFTGPLGAGETFGRAWYSWWNAQAPYDHGLRGWIYGMVLSGDPTLTVFQPPLDCNGNGIPDDEDIASGFSEDCNANGIPDECELSPETDCNNNGILDECDVTAGTSEDCNNNLIPDECELSPETDCNTNGILDVCDIASGFSEDCNGNSVPDDCDIADGTSLDIDDNGIPDECQTAVRLVDSSASAGGDGMTWDSAYDSLQTALAEAGAGVPITEIWVAAGTYRPAPPDGDRAATFELPDGVAILGGFVGDETDPTQRDPILNVTILSGDLNGNDTLGFQNIADNSYHVVTTDESPTDTGLDGFVVTGGNADGGFPNNAGGGLTCVASSAMIVNCTFEQNTGALGAAVCCTNGEPTFVNCVFRNNQAGLSGGGLRAFHSAPTLVNCVFDGNTSSNYGGAIDTEFNCTPTVLNCTMSGNDAASGGGLCVRGGSNDVTVSNSILWNNTATNGAQIHVGGIATLTVSYSDIEGGWQGVGNINVNPLFAQPTAGDFCLSEGSPCIDTGSNDAVPPDMADLDGDGDVAELTPLDLDGRARIVDGDANGTVIVDMGAYEFGQPLEPGDLDCDGDVDFDDINPFVLALSGQAAYETQHPGCNWLNADCDSSGTVDFDDINPFVALLGG